MKEAPDTYSTGFYKVFTISTKASELHVFTMPVTHRVMTPATNIVEDARIRATLGGDMEEYEALEADCQGSKEFVVT